MQTVIIFDQMGQEVVEFLVVDGDCRHLNGVYINGDHERVDELYSLLHDRHGAWRENVRRLKEFPLDFVRSNPDVAVIVAGWLP